MSLVTTATAKVAAGAGASAIVAPVAITAGVLALGYALAKAPFWRDIENTTVKRPEPDCWSVEGLQADLLAKTERHCERLLQVANSKIPASAIESVAGVMALNDSKFMAGAVHEYFKGDFDAVLEALPSLNSLRAEIEKLNARTVSVIEGTLKKTTERLRTIIAEQLEAAIKDVGFVVKQEATGDRGTAFIAESPEGETLAAYIDDRGNLTTDMAGFAGRSCEAAISRLHLALEKRGVRLDRKKEQPHYLFKGGVLLCGPSGAEQILKKADAQSHKRQTARQNGTTVVRNGDSRARAKRAHLLDRLRQLSQ